jgi:hypothetical protein
MALLFYDFLTSCERCTSIHYRYNEVSCSATVVMVACSCLETLHYILKQYAVSRQHGIICLCSEFSNGIMLLDHSASSAWCQCLIMSVGGSIRFWERTDLNGSVTPEGSHVGYTIHSIAYVSGTAFSDNINSGEDVYGWRLQLKVLF